MNLSTLKANALSILKTPVDPADFLLGIMVATLVIAIISFAFILLKAAFANLSVGLSILGVILFAVLCAKIMRWKYT